MRGWWAFLILAGCHDPEAESLRARVSAQQEEIAGLKSRLATTMPEPTSEPDLRDLERETDLLRKRVALLEKPAAPETQLLAVSADGCWVLYSRPAELSTGDFKMDRRLTLACYRQDGRSMKVVDVREIAPDLEMIQLNPDGRPRVADVIKELKKK